MADEQEDTQSTSEIVENVEIDLIDYKAPWPAYSEIFTFEPKLSNEKNFAFTCKYCIGKKIIHANRSSTANLKKHINVSCIFHLFGSIIIIIYSQNIFRNLFCVVII